MLGEKHADIRQKALKLFFQRLKNQQKSRPSCDKRFICTCQLRQLDLARKTLIGVLMNGDKGWAKDKTTSGWQTNR